MNGILQRHVELIGKKSINEERENAYLPVRDQSRQFPRNLKSRGREEAHQPCRKELVERHVFSKEIAENRDHKKTEGNKGHEEEIRDGSCEQGAIISEETDKAFKE
jgi:hypothetical protein